MHKTLAVAFITSVLKQQCVHDSLALNQRRYQCNILFIVNWSITAYTVAFINKLISV